MDEPARQRATEALRVHVPALADNAVVGLGHGLDNTAFVAGDLVLRVADSRSVIREARLLELVAPRVSIPVPAPRFVDEDGGVLAYPLISGRPLLGRATPPGAASRLGRFLRELHSVNSARLTDLIPSEDADPYEWLEDLDGPQDLIELVRASVPPPARRHVLAHADLGAEHILESNGLITGVIDWSDAAVTDPALDFARLYRDFGPSFLAEAVDAYGGLADAHAAMARAESFARCAALEDLAYGRDSGRSEYTHAAEQSIAWLFRRSRSR
jgi:aminoglycoside phosphotransferase (APT) family kinase protein